MCENSNVLRTFLIEKYARWEGVVLSAIVAPGVIREMQFKFTFHTDTFRQNTVWYFAFNFMDSIKCTVMFPYGMTHFICVLLDRTTLPALLNYFASFYV